MDELICICKAVQCPYYDAANGCQRYSSAWLCHLPSGATEVDRNDMRANPSEYWLYGSHQVDVPALQQSNDAFFAQPDEQHRLQMIAKRTHGTIPETLVNKGD
jgi:hypothetical protein